MGGLNPNRNDGWLVNRAVQDHCLVLFRALSSFFAAHATLEELVIAEAEGGGQVDESALAAAAAAFVRARTDFDSLAPAITDEVLSAADEHGTWQGEYFRRQLEFLAPAAPAAASLATQASSDSFGALDTEGLQESMWHQGSNAAIRTNSDTLLRAALAALEHHLDVVEATNRPE